MKRFFLGIYDFMSAHKPAAIAFLVLAMAASFALSLRLDYREDIAAFLPQDKISAEYASLYQKLGGTGKIAFFFSSTDDSLDQGSRIAFISSAMSDFESVWQEEDSLCCIPDVQSRIGQGAVTEVFNFVSANYPYFLSDADYERMDSLLSDGLYVSKRLETIRTSMYLPSSGLFTRYFRSDPLDLFSPVLGRLSSLNPVGRSRVENGFLFTDDGSTGIIFIDSPHGGSESGENALVADISKRVIGRLEALHPSLRAYATGGPLVAVENATRIKKDSILALSLSLLLITLLLFFSYKRFADVLYIGLSILCGAVFSLGFISIFKTDLSVIILGIGSIIIGIAANYPLHFIDHLKYRPDKRRALSDQVTPLVVGNLTTVGAFLSLAFMKAEALRTFGLVGAMLLVGTIIFVLVFLPPLFPMASRPRRTLDLDIAGRMNVSRGIRTAALAAFLILTVLFALFSSRVEFDTDLHNINYMTSEQEEGFRVLESLSASENDAEKIFIVSSNAGLESEVAVNEALYQFVKDSLNVSGLVSLYDFLPSGERQLEALARWNQFKKDHSGQFAELFARAPGFGFASQAFLHFAELLDRQFEVREASYFCPLLSAAGSAMYLEGGDGADLVTYLFAQADECESLKTSIRSHFGDKVLCFSSSDVSGRLVNALSDDFDKVGFICSILVFIFLWISFGTLELTIIAFLPLAVSWIWILGVMGMAGWKFNIINIILATFIFGQGDDYTIFITEGLLYEYSTGKKILRSFRNSVTLSSLLMFVGMGSLITARHPAMSSLGLITIVGMITVVIMAHYLPPLLFKPLVTKGGKERMVPVTIVQVGRTLWMLIVFLAAMLVLSIVTALMFLSGTRSLKRRDQYHCLLQKVSALALKSIPGVKCSFRGKLDGKPSVIVCNHQSHLDVLALMALTPKVVILTTDWVWRNPFYGFLVHMAEFYPVSDGWETNFERIRSLVDRGYSIAVFPEGTRSEDCDILRFHRGAALLAHGLGLDIQPVIIHGFGYALPKKEMLLRQCDIFVEVGERISDIPDDAVSFTKDLRQFYKLEYNRIRLERETPSYFRWLVVRQYTYKGREALSECRRMLSDRGLTKMKSLPHDIRGVRVTGSGYGAFALLLSLSRPGLEVEAYEMDEDKHLVAGHCTLHPSGLHHICGKVDGPLPPDFVEIDLEDV